VSDRIATAAAEWAVADAAPVADVADVELLKYKDVQRALKLSRRSVVILANRGDLPRVRILGSVRFRKSDVMRLVDASTKR
jgi:predicted DNA-binding transcriptional regulator AlpA